MKQSKIHFIIQARTGSTRFPNKILIPFYQGKSLLELLVYKLKQVENTEIIIATSDNKNCDAIETLALLLNVKCFRGSETDVLQRFIDAAISFNAENIIRVCSDNPFLELQSIKKLIKVAQENKNSDYISFNINGTPSIKTHYGFWTEYVTLDTLKRIKSLTKDKIFHEHVTNYIYTNPHSFKIRWIDGPIFSLAQKNIRLTIDTNNDFLNAQKIYSDICRNNLYPTICDICEYLDKHIEYYTVMQKEIEQNSK